MSEQSEQRPRVVIIGGGFGGLYAARALAGDPVQVTLVDRINYHLFQPLLYQVATAVLNPSDIAAPLRHVLRAQDNAEVVLGEVAAIDTAARRVQLLDGELTYDHLIVATGATHSYFGHGEWAARAPGLKSIEDALEIRRRVLLAYEAAERELDEERRRSWMTFVIIGAGPTGVELAGAFAEIARQALRGDFRHIDPAAARVILVEGLDRVLPVYDAVLSEKARQQLAEIGVEVMTSRMVVDIDEQGVTLAPPGATQPTQPAQPEPTPTAVTRLAARTTIWAAGVAGSPLGRSLGVPLDRAGRVLVNPDLTIPGDDRVYVIGDLAALTVDGVPVPGVAPAAILEGRHAARNIHATMLGQPRAPFRYRDKGQLATIGRRAGVGSVGRLRFSGFLAWMMWAFIHVLFLIGFRNRVLVILEWAWSYFTFQRGARLITGDQHPRLMVPTKRDPPGTS